MFVWLLFNRVLSLVSLLNDGLFIWGINWAFLMILLLRIEAFHLFGAIRIKTWLFLCLLFIERNWLFFMVLMGNLLQFLVLRGLGRRVDWLWVIWLWCGALMKRIRVFLLRNVRMLLIFITLIVFICDLILVFIPRLLHFLLHIRGENWIFCQNLLFGHLQTLEEKVCLGLGDFVLVFLSQILSCFQFKVLFVLTLGLTDVVLKRLLFNLHFYVLFLLSWELLIWNIHGFSLFLEITGILQRGRSFKICFESSVHVW